MEKAFVAKQNEFINRALDDNKEMEVIVIVHWNNIEDAETACSEKAIQLRPIA